MRVALLFFALLSSNAAAVGRKARRHAAGHPHPDHQVVMSHVLFRHGDRTPTSPMPDDMFGYNSYWTLQSKQVARSPTGRALRNQFSQSVRDANTIWKQLTPVGVAQATQLGKRLRHLFVEQLALLPSHNPGKRLKFLTTTTMRTAETLQHVLQTMYPNERLDKDIKFTETVEETERRREAAKQVDKSLRETQGYRQQILPKIRLAYELVLKTMPNAAAMAAAQRRQLDATSNDDLVKHMSSFVNNVSDAVNCRQSHQLSPSVPFVTLSALKAVSSLWPKTHFTIGGAAVVSTAVGQDATRLALGLQKARASPNVRSKVVLVSSHDTVIAGLLTALGRQVTTSNVPYTSTLEFRVVRSARSARADGVVVLFNNKPMSLPRCGGVVCDLDLFVSLLPVETSHF